MEISGDFFTDVYGELTIAVLFVGWVILIPYAIGLVAFFMKKKTRPVVFQSLTIFITPIVALFFLDKIIKFDPVYTCQEGRSTCEGGELADTITLITLGLWVFAVMYLFFKVWRINNLGSKDSYDKIKAKKLPNAAPKKRAPAKKKAKT